MKKIVLTLCAAFTALSMFAAPYDLIATLGSKPGSFSKIPAKGKPPVIEYAKSFYIRPALNDWSKYNTFSLELKNQSSQSVVVYFRIISQPKGVTKGVWGYDWQTTVKPGKEFQKFTIPFNKMTVCRKPVGWKQIDRIDFCLIGKTPKDYKVSIRNLVLTDGAQPAAK